MSTAYRIRGGSVEKDSTVKEDDKASLLSSGVPLAVIVIGGSLAGLMHATMLAHHGHHVRILEQSTASRRSGLAGGGITFSTPTSEFLSRFHNTVDNNKSFGSWAVESHGLQLVDCDGTVSVLARMPAAFTGWEQLYYRLRAGFDGVEACQANGVGGMKRGRVQYHLGKRVRRLERRGTKVAVKYDELLDGGKGMLLADLVIAADGANSLVRQMLNPDVQRHYAGFLAWRGAVPESDVPDEVRRLVGTRKTLCEVDGTYLVLWTIPTPSSSHDYIDTLTDTSGHQHIHILLSPRPEVWKRQKSLARRLLPRSYSDVFTSIKRPFVTAVNDVTSPQAAFWGGKVLLVGDAVALGRWEYGASVDRAAVHCLLLEKVLTGEIGVQEWEEEVLGLSHWEGVKGIDW